ncbi:S8 family serine peptidase, partial [Cryptosporangium minutisporangium]|uniref:S8 family serine peptidase n=1 Tax=Cryptosporangium minutisporangium TaxID=113569 RepID=UPI0031EFF61E
MTRPTPRPTRTFPRRARLTAGIAGLSLAAGSVAGVIAVAGGGSATVAAPAPTGAPPTTVAGPAGASGSAPAGAPTTDARTGTAATGTGRTDWDAPAANVTAAPASVVGDVAANQPVRIVTVRSVDGRPSVVTTTVNGRASATAAVAAAQRDATTVSVGVDRVLRLSVTSDDPRRAAQWALTTLRAEQTWTATTGKTVTVAVVDTGVQASHPDLAGSVLSGVDLVRDDPKSIDGSKDDNGHGTHVAGIIAAVANNRIGVAGLAPGAKILPVRVLDGDGAGYDSDIADGIVRAVDRGATVVNLSIGGTEAGATSYAVRYALSKNVVVVAAAGNEREEGNPVSYPAADAGVIGVAATDWSDTDAPFSNTGDYVDVAAPGVGIWSTYRGSTYKQLSGTSMATPYVAAAAALIRAVSPDLTPAAVGSLLERTATDLGTVGRDDATGHGLVDPYAAVCSLVTCGGSTTPTAGPTGSPTSSPTTSPSPSTSPTAPAS